MVKSIAANAHQHNRAELLAALKLDDASSNIAEARLYITRVITFDCYGWLEIRKLNHQLP